MAVRFSPGLSLLPGNIIFLLLVLFSVRLSKPLGLVQPEGLDPFKISIISSVLEPTA
jgi:hypothetical protein